MRMIRPRLVAPQLTVAEEQHEYKPATAAAVNNPAYASAPGRPNTLIVCYELNDYERKLIAAGEPIYLHLLTFGGAMQPHILSVGTKETAGMYRLEVEA